MTDTSAAEDSQTAPAARPRWVQPSAVAGTTLSLLAIALGVATWWDVLNPITWTAGGWSAVGGWVAGLATFLAVGVALLDSHRTRLRARREIAAAEDRAELARWDAQRDREITALVAFRQPVRAMCFRLVALERHIVGFNECDGFYTPLPPPAISDDAAQLLDELEAFNSDYLLHAYGQVEDALIVVRDSTIRAAVQEVHNELQRLQDTVDDWKDVLGLQGAPVLPESGVSLAAALQLLLIDLRDSVDEAYPFLPPKVQLRELSSGQAGE
ncbi:hypothetical protein [Prescottella agglutinans]|uniref:Uncharacterized protein n=1 Tax=Prescottella agglutinans TaxID=1644129 RepID=A0ABT6MJW3_9NOCA|nr:hypothetical protein [Prescottella agglutinans]MDH6284607.1 hypothetical protein [Prescottella agglutinans]